MSRWFRWYEGTIEDAKFRAVARESRVTVRDAVALWAFILEDAAHLSHRGVCLRGEKFMAAALDFEDGVVGRIITAMREFGMLIDGDLGLSVCNWDKRQFDGDADTTAARRQREKRERDKLVSHEGVTRDSRGSENRVTDSDKITDASASVCNETLPDEPRKKINRAESDQVLLDSVTDQWNDWARNKGSPQVARLTAKRAVHCRKRIEDLMAYGHATASDAFGFLLSKCDQSFFARGSPRKPLTFNQLMREDFMTEMLEGSYAYQERKYGQAQKSW